MFKMWPIPNSQETKNQQIIPVQPSYSTENLNTFRTSTSAVPAFSYSYKHDSSTSASAVDVRAPNSSCFGGHNAHLPAVSGVTAHNKDIPYHVDVNDI